MIRRGAVSGDSSKLGVLACVFAAGLGLSMSSVAHAQVQWKSGTPDAIAPDRAVDRGVGGAGFDQLLAQADRQRVVIRFDAPLSESQKNQIAAKGVRLLSPLGENTYFATIEQGKTNAAAISAMDSFKGVDAIRTDWKLHRDLVNDVIQPWTVVSQKIVEDEQDGAKLEAVVAVYVLFHGDVELRKEATGFIHAAGGSVRSYMHSINGAVVEMDFSRIKELARVDEVQYIEPALPLFDELNAENRVITQVNDVQAAPYSLDGTGVTVMVYDGGQVLDTHMDFSGRATIGPSDTDGTSNHATHVAGTIAGDGTASGGVERGMAPNANILSYGFQVPGGLMPGFLYTDPGDLEADYTEALSLGAVIANNSIGSNTAPNGFPCEWEGDYGVTASLIDAIARGSLGSPFRIVWAAGNERQGFAPCGSGFGTTAPPSNAKNSITVGALNSDDDSVTGFTSFGPSDDGRLRPVVSAPGCQISEDGGVRSLSSAGISSYTVLCGTSMSSPTVAGISALILQDYRAQFPSEPEMLSSTLKTFLVHSALDIENPGPDNMTGYGSVRARDAIDFLRTGNFFEDTVSQGSSRGALAIVNPGDPELKITLAWDDAPGTPNVIPSLVNDLDLVVTSPSGTQFFPWSMVPGDPGANALRTVPNTLDNIEQVFVEFPEPGAWTIQVVGTDVPQGPQEFSLAVTPFLVNCTDAGTVTFIGAEFLCNGSVTVRVNDCGLNTSDMVVDTVDVTVERVGGGSIVLTLTESAAESADFSGKLLLGTDLIVSDGDTIMVTYNDADDGTGSPAVSTDTASIDCVPPVAQSVSIDDIGARDAVVTITTDEPSVIEIFYGENCAAPTDSVVSGSLSTSHTVTLTGLQSSTDYAFSFAMSDAAGNGSTDDNGGACYTFTTPDIPDYFTEIFESADNDLSGFMTTFMPDGSSDFYTACTTPIIGFPTDPAGGTALPLSDDDSETVAVMGGNSVLLYGQSYTSMFVGSNGFITFDSPDTDTSETLADHFSQIRISGLFDDLNPAVLGTVSVLQLADRVVVTYDDVAEFGTTNSNSFQISMYFNGMISIAWVSIDVNDGLAGLSEGNGLDPEFFESDIASMGTCGPQPPLATSVSVMMVQATSEQIVLASTDDGLPDPPASVTTIITSLPAHPLVDPGTGSTIVPFLLPYTLVSGGNEVTYTPSLEFVGMDSFQFIADDGGMAPDGGASNTGTVSITVNELFMLPFEDMFDSNTFDTVKWTFIDGADVDDSLSISPPSAPFSMHLDGNPDGSDEIQSALIDLSSATNATLSWWFQRRGAGNSPEVGEDLVVEFLDAGSNWIEIDRQAGDGPDMATFAQVSVVLPVEAMHNAFRFRYRNTATTGDFDDWFIDDVLLDADLACTADVNGDGTVDFNDLLDTVFLFGDAGGPGDADGNGIVDFNDLIFILFRFGPC